MERLDLYLRDRVPQLCRTHRKFPEQIPTTIVEPRQKSYLILLPQYATSQDIATLKMEAFKTAQLDKNLDLAEHLWIRVLAVAQGQEPDAIRALQAIAVQKEQLSKSSPSRKQSSTPRSVKPTAHTRSSYPQKVTPKTGDNALEQTEEIERLGTQEKPVRQELIKLEILEESTLPLQAPPANLSLDLRSADSRSSPPPVHPPYQREEVRPLTPLSTPVVQTIQPVNNRSQRAIPWFGLIILGLLHTLCGMLLTSDYALSWGLAWAGAGAGAGAMTWTVCAGAVDVAGAVTWLVVVAMALSWGVAGVGAVAVAVAVAGLVARLVDMSAAEAFLPALVAVIMAWAWAVAGVGEELLVYFSRFQTFLILTGTSWLGLGLGVLGYWAVKAATGL